MRLFKTILGFFNEILTSIKRYLYEVAHDIQHNEGDNKYYYIPVEEYYSMSIRVAKEFHISPREVYEEWSLPMMLVTYVFVYNSSLTDYGYQQEQSKAKHPQVIHYESEYIRNITPEMIAEATTQVETKTEFAPEQEALRALYERT